MPALAANQLALAFIGEYQIEAIKKDQQLSKVETVAEHHDEEYIEVGTLDYKWKHGTHYSIMCSMFSHKTLVMSNFTLFHTLYSKI